MAKILLVEDDNNLREIFEMRLKAEGYTIVTAHDGEQALVVAMQEKPDLVISDVMMPKLSGFEMIETLKAAPEMKNIKVIMMTALGQAEDRSQGDKLGVDKYLVKSQVTLEDFVRVTKEVLDGTPSAADKVDPADPALQSIGQAPAASPAAAPPAPTPAAPPAPVNNAMPAPVAPSPAEPATVTPTPAPLAASPGTAATPTPGATAPEPAAAPLSALQATPTPVTSTTEGQETNDEAMAAVENQINNFVANKTDAPPAPTAAPTDAAAPEAEKGGPKNSEPAKPIAPTPSIHEKRLEPINDLTQKPDWNKMAADQEAKDNAMQPLSAPPTGSVVNAVPGAAASPVIEDIKPTSAEVSALPASVTFDPAPVPEPTNAQTPAAPAPTPAMPGMVPSPALVQPPAPAADPKTPLDPNAVAL